MATSEKSIQFKIVTPEGIVYEDTVEQVTLPTTTGQITVLPNHIPLVSLLSPGALIVKKNGYEIALAVSRGMIEVRPGSKVCVMADTAEHAEAIDTARAEAAKARAEQLLKQQEQLADVDFARIQSSIEKELARLRVATKYRKIPPS